MNIATYESLTGLTVTSARTALVTATIGKTQKILEGLLGFSLDDRDNNEYTESGKTAQECPCPTNEGTLQDPDAVVYAYRLYPYNHLDKYLEIDPATAIHAVKLVKDDVAYKTLETTEYRVDWDRGIAKYIQQLKCWWTCNVKCEGVQLAVDATWEFATIPDDLNYVWADMITFYSDETRDLRSETLGTHSYTRFSNTPPERTNDAMAVIERYAGPHGSVRRHVI